MKTSNSATISSLTTGQRELDNCEIETVTGGLVTQKPSVPTGTGPYAPGDPTTPEDPYHTHYN